MRLSISFFSIILLASASLSGQNLHDEIVQYREEMKTGFLTNPRSPLDSQDLQFLRWFPTDESFRVTCSVERLDTAQIEIPTYSGLNRKYRPFARLHFMLNDQSFQLTVFRYEEPGFAAKLAPLFLPFKDETNGEDTYGGGRYINIAVSDLEHEAYLLDFNKAYNPWCAYSDGFNCPIPPVENHLALAIAAGERNYAGPYKSIEK
jgi:uncharacterized protein